jgi:hypothetical protein
MTGLHLAQYRIDSELGRGGMGIVYKATDTKLNRTVALKVLPAAALSSDDDRARFVREAQSAAQLHHPNIATVFGIDEAVPVEPGKEPQPGTESRLFIAMEFIEGETVREIVEKGPMKLQDAVNIAGQVAEALKEAHAKQIVHRDIKSANVMLTQAGVAKVLDFGLAKTNQSTMLTRMGSTLGTVAYMSPEQARGHEVDGRTDLYSLGTMLYEMVAGKLPFAGDYEQAVLYGILNEQPEPLTAVRTGVPMELERIVAKLLAKEAEYRYQTAADLLADLKSLSLGGSGITRRSMPATSAVQMPAAATPGKLPKWVYGAIAGALIVGSIGAWLAKPVAPPPYEPTVRFSVPLPSGENLYYVGRRSVAVTPDGGTVAYVTSAGLVLRHMSDIERSIHVPGLPRLREVFTSPDGQWIGFENMEENWLMRVGIGGGAPVQITTLPTGLYGAHWDQDGFVYLGLGLLGMGRVPAIGGTIEMLAGPDSVNQFGYRMPSPLPDGRSVLFTRASDGKWDEAEIRVLDLESGEDRLVHAGGSDARYVDPGFVVFRWQETIYAFRIDVDRREKVGGQFPVGGSVFTVGTGVAHFDVSRNGTLVKAPGTGAADGVRLAWIEPDGTSRLASSDYRDYAYFEIAPDGRQIAATIEGSIWLIDGERGTSTLLDGDGFGVAWSPDGSTVAFGRNEMILARRPAEPEALDTLLAGSPQSWATPTDWSRDGRYLLYDFNRSGQSTDIFYLDLETGRSMPFLDPDADVERAAFSPDGRWVAYHSDETDTDEVYVRRFPGGENRLRISTAGGEDPAWRADGQALYFMQGAAILEVEFDPETGSVANARTVADANLGTRFNFSISPVDGRPLVRTVADMSAASSGPSLEVVIHWFNEFANR